MKKQQVFSIKFIIIVLLIVLTFYSARAKINELEITYTVTRVGTSIPGVGIQGQFTVHVTGPAGLERVEFYMDDILKSNDTESPFVWVFITDNYDPGVHAIKMIGYTTDDSGTAEFTRNFLSGMDPLVLAPMLLVVAVIGFYIFRFVRKRQKKMETAGKKKGEEELWGKDEDQDA